MRTVKSATVIALLLAHAAATPRVPSLPSCGNVERDIGRGFRLTQYMFDGSPEFTLKFQPSAKAVVAPGLKMTAPFQLMFSQMDFEELVPGQSGLAGPHIGFANYEFREQDGTRIGSGAMELECGNETVIRANYSPEPPLDYVKAPVTFHQPFLGQPEQACLRALQQGQRFKFTIAGRGSDHHSLVIEDRISLRWAISEARRAWRIGLKRANQGRCRLMSSPPPPF